MLRFIGMLTVLAVLLWTGILGWTLEVVGRAIWSLGTVL